MLCLWGGFAAEADGLDILLAGHSRPEAAGYVRRARTLSLLLTSDCG